MPSFPLVPAQSARLKRFNATRSVDMHCHILPGVDDGPRNPAEAIALCRLLVEDGITDVIATPHQLGRWDGTNNASAVRKAVSQLQAEVSQAKLPLTIHAGGEVRLDERIPKLLQTDQVQTLGDGKRYLLLELPPSLLVDPKILVPFLTGGNSGMRIVLAHAERYDALIGAEDMEAAVGAWTSLGVVLQVNASSLLGESGEWAENAAWHWLERGWVALLASDAHSTGRRRPRLQEAIDEIVERLGDDVAKRVCSENPVRLLEGRELV
ncbi:MAG TPA: CpsB/CapC family capsule biosynthesis tyrosine phosphatase [Tepidisphaeraceae bacterium]|jgi:protein-tyrosine phosphatase